VFGLRWSGGIDDEGVGDGLKQRLGEWWAGLPEGAAIGVGVGATVFAFIAVMLLVKRISRGNSRLMVGAAALNFGALAALLINRTLHLPHHRAGVFVLWEQAVRAGAALSVTGFVVCLLALSIPPVLNAFERGDFISFVAARHVRSKKSGFLTIISLLSILGVALSSFALCAVISIMGGFGADLKAKILDNNANIRIESPDAGGFEYWREIVDKVTAMEGVAAATAVAGGEVMASSSTTTAGVQLRGIHTQSFRKVVDVPNHMEVGSFDYLDDPLKLRVLPPETPIGIGKNGELFLKGPSPEYEDLEDTDEAPEDIFPGVVLGRELARNLHAYVGDELTLVSPMGDLGPMGLMPRSRKFRVAGIFYTGMYEYDSSHAYVTLESAQELLDLKHFVTAVDLRVNNVDHAELMTPRIKDLILREDLKVRDWKEMNRNLFSALQLEKLATFVILSIAIAVASFCIICTLLLMVTEKSKEIAIMKAMGASDGSILRLFLTEGMLIGGVGTLFGVVTGFASMYGLEKARISLDPEVYYIERLPVYVNGSDYVLIAVCAFVITTLATLYPARAASGLSPVDGIRYE
jgi:lipoprotein-releasing system permease protein